MLRFDIDRPPDYIHKTPDYERPSDTGRNNTYDITVIASDGTHSALADVAVTVTDTDEAPEVTGETAVPYAEDSTHLVDDYSANDPERKTLIWSVGGTDQDDFVITQTGRLSFDAVPDYENPTDSGNNNVYLVTVQASDGINTGVLDVTVTVGNEDEDGAISLASQQPEVGTPLTASLDDPDWGDATRRLGVGEFRRLLAFVKRSDVVLPAYGRRRGWASAGNGLLRGRARYGQERSSDALQIGSGQTGRQHGTRVPVDRDGTAERGREHQSRRERRHAREGHRR